MKYVETFAKDGRLILNPQYLKDDMRKNGINSPLDYDYITTLNWEICDNEMLEIETGQGNQQVPYDFFSDTLLLGYDNGNNYLLKRK